MSYKSARPHLLTALALLCQQASAATYYVSTGYDDGVRVPLPTTTITGTETLAKYACAADVAALFAAAN